MFKDLGRMWKDARGVGENGELATTIARAFFVVLFCTIVCLGLLITLVAEAVVS